MCDLQTNRSELRSSESQSWLSSGLCLLRYCGLLTRFHLRLQLQINSRKPARRAAHDSANEETPAPTDNSPKVAFPLPNSFGIYVLSDNKLTELEPLPISIPDARIALSAEIDKPSATTISDERPAFILFRRDLLNNVPQKIMLRVIAHMARETKIVGGKAGTTNIDGAWRIRNISRELKISPIPGQREMVIARLDGDVPLATGRYALVLNRTGYDFAVKGTVQSPEFCLEKFETSSGSVFNQCRTP